MRDNTIRAGDLVAVVEPTPCCGANIGTGVVYYVASVTHLRLRCSACGAVYPAHAALSGRTASDGKPSARAISRLQKIHGPETPLNVPEYVPQETVLG